jgi:hypothetical protein
MGNRVKSYKVRNAQYPAIGFDTVVGESWRSMHEFLYLDDVPRDGFKAGSREEGCSN